MNVRLKYYGRRGNNAMKVEMGPVDLWFSYETLVAFAVQGKGRFVRRNDWSATTGKHLNEIDGGDKDSRLTAEQFAAAWEAHVEGAGLGNRALAQP